MYTTTQNNVYNTDGLVQERRNSSALAVELRLSCINPSTSAVLQHVPTAKQTLPHKDSTGLLFVQWNTGSNWLIICYLNTLTPGGCESNFKA